VRSVGDCTTKLARWSTCRTEGYWLDRGTRRFASSALSACTSCLMDLLSSSLAHCDKRNRQKSSLYVSPLAHVSTCRGRVESWHLTMLAVSSARLHEAHRSLIAYELQRNASNNCSARESWSATCQWVVSAHQLCLRHAISQSISQQSVVRINAAQL